MILIQVNNDSDTDSTDNESIDDNDEIICNYLNIQFNIYLLKN